MDNIRHAEADGVAVAFTGKIAEVNPFKTGSGPWVRLAGDAAVDDFGVHAGAGDILANFVEHEDIEVKRNAAHPRFSEGEKLLFALFHRFDRDGFDVGGLMIGVFENREATQDFA